MKSESILSIFNLKDIPQREITLTIYINAIKREPLRGIIKVLLNISGKSLVVYIDDKQKKQHNSICWEKIPKLKVPPSQKITIKHEERTKKVA